MRHMRDFGFGRRSENVENILTEEIQKVMEIITTGKGDDGVPKLTNTIFFLTLTLHSSFLGYTFQKRRHFIPRHTLRTFSEYNLLDYGFYSFRAQIFT